MNNYFGTKQEVTQVWTVSRKRLPVTVIKVAPMKVAKVLTEANDGYVAVQFEMGKLKREVRGLAEAEVGKKVGEEITIDQVLAVGDVVHVTGTSKGRGFTGPMVRWNFKGGPKTHGQSDRARAPGAIGQGTSPGRIHKGKKMAGHSGDTTITVRNLRVVKIDTAKQELWIAGLVPGSKTAWVGIEKKQGKTKAFEGLYETNN